MAIFTYDTYHMSSVGIHSYFTVGLETMKSIANKLIFVWYFVATTDWCCCRIKRRYVYIKLPKNSNIIASILPVACFQINAHKCHSISIILINPHKLITIMNS